jgi:hypothetical protein
MIETGVAKRRAQAIFRIAIVRAFGAAETRAGRTKLAPPSPN